MIASSVAALVFGQHGPHFLARIAETAPLWPPSASPPSWSSATWDRFSGGAARTNGLTVRARCTGAPRIPLRIGESRRRPSRPAGVAEDAAEAQMAGGGVDCLGLAGRWAVTQA